jgi:hypothetical protein
VPVLLSRPFRALGLASAAFCLLALPAEARRATPAASETEPAGAQAGAAPPEVAWTSGEAQAPNCPRFRRKLWQSGEGWVVKTVSTCR